MFSRTSRLNQKPVVLRIFRVLHTVQFSRFVVVCSQQQLVYLITTRCVCQQLFSIFLKVLFVFNFPRIQRCIRFYHFSSFVSSTFQNFLFFFEAFCFFLMPCRSRRDYNTKAFYKSQLLFFIFSHFFFT